MTNLQMVYGAIVGAEGIIYRDFDDDSIYEFLCEHGFMPVQTYKGWQNLGYQVQKGEKTRLAIPLWIHKKGKKAEVIDADADGETAENRRDFYMKTSYLFDFSQVARIGEEVPASEIEDIDIPILEDDIPDDLDCNDLEIEKGTDDESVPENEVHDIADNNEKKSNAMQYNYKPIEKKKEVIDEDLPRTCRTALNKYVKNLMSEKTNASPITRQINFDEKHGEFILDGFTAIYMNFDRYIVPMPKSGETMNHSFIPEYAEKSWDVLSIKDLKDAFKGYKQTTGAKMGYFKIRNTILDAKRLIDTVGIIDNKAFVIEYTDNAREICLLIGSYGKAIICPMNPNGIDESMIIGSIE